MFLVSCLSIIGCLIFIISETVLHRKAVKNDAGIKRLLPDQINTVLQDIEYPAQIYFIGLKGFAPQGPLWLLKALIGGKITVFGICNEVNVYYDLG